MVDNRKFHTVRGYQLICKDKKLLTSAMEDYLEMIYRNSLKREYLRINTLANLLNVQAPSVTKMVQKLACIGLVKYEKYGIIFLTKNGKEIGKFLLKRHKILEEFLNFLGVKDNILVETELVEHNISPQTVERIELFNQFIKKNPDVKEKLNDYFESYNL